MKYSFQSKKNKLQRTFYKNKSLNNPNVGLFVTKKTKTPFIADPFSDLLTRIRNGCNAKKTRISIPYSKKNLEFLKVLLRENLIQSIKLHAFLDESDVTSLKIINSNTHYIEIELKYSSTGESRIKKIVQISKYSRRISCRLTHIKKDLFKTTKLLNVKHINFSSRNQYTLWILNTSQGILSEQEAIRRNIAGEILCWIM
jgi:small subunit ribosomal protein S8